MHYVEPVTIGAIRIPFLKIKLKPNQNEHLLIA